MGQVLRMDGRDAAPTRAAAPEVRARILELVPATLPELARQMLRPPSDRTLRRRVADLEAEGLIIRGAGDRLELAPEPEVPPVDLPDGFEDYVFPAHFDHEAQVVFVVKLDEFEFVDWTSTALELLESYVGCLQRARLAHTAVATTGDFSTAKTGRVYVHPGVAVIQKADRDAQVYREALIKLDEKGGGKSDPDQAPLF